MENGAIFALRGVTEEQKETIRSLFNHYNWDLEEVNPAELNRAQQISSPRQNEEVMESANNNQDEVPVGEANDEEVDTEPGQPYMNDFRLEHDQEREECQICLCKPCISDEHHRQLWWETEDHEPNEDNHDYRRLIYKRFWTMLLHYGVWEDPRYQERKVAALSTDPRRKEYVYHKRDIMPKCVIVLVRRWFPNPASLPYMGHMWE